MPTDIPTAIDTALDQSPAPAPTPAAAPAPSPAATAATPGSAPAPAAAPAAAPVAAPTNDELAAYKALGLSPAQVAELVARDRNVRAAIQRAEQEERAAHARTPEGQKQAARRQAFVELAKEVGLDPDALRALAHDASARAEESAASRTREARDTFTAEMSRLGIRYDDSPEGRAAAKQDEDLVAGVLQSNDELNAMYFDPTRRAEAIARASAMVAGVVNRHLIAQGAADLRAAAARRASVPRHGSPTSLATATDAVPKWNGNRRDYLAASRAAASSLLDEVLANQQ